MEKRIFFSYAHPDDETFTVGGLLAKYAEDPHVETIVYSATLGDAGKCGNPAVCNKDDLASVREQELIEACQLLGVDHLQTGKFSDGKLDTVNQNELIQTVTKLLEKYKPEVVVTFPPDGISGHRDHIAISKATLEAVKNSQFVKRLYYVALPSMHPSYDVAIPIADKHLPVVQQALRAHKTQHLSVERVFPTIYKEQFSKHDNVEYFISVIEKSPRENEVL